MQQRSLNQMTRDARSVADQLGTQTTEALIRAVSGARQRSHEGVETAAAGMEALGGKVEQVGHKTARSTPSLALPRVSVRAAWRAGRYIGRIEGALRLARFGTRFWWRRRQRRKDGQRSMA